VVDTGEPNVDYETTGRTAATGDEAHTWRSACYPVRVRGAVVGVGLIVRDVTAEKRAQELQRFLVGIVGHDLRNPLSVLTTTTQLLARSEGLSDRQAGLLGRMRNATEQMTRLINDLLDYTRIRGGSGLPIEPRPTHLAEVLEPVIQELRLANPGCAIVLRGTGDGAGAWDPERLRQVFSNLIGNAVKHGQGAQPIEVGWEGAGDEVAIEVRNRGEPIPAAALPLIFEPLAQLDGPRRSRDGIGLGLFIARQLVEAHGGRISAASGPDGTIFTVRLPRNAVLPVRPDAERAGDPPP
jgi:signal transduction histidine kinase